MSNLGQYFTKNDELKQKILEFVLNKPDDILEPSIGRGDLVSFITEKMSNVTFDMYEIDKKIVLLDNIQKNSVIYCDFLKQSIEKKYKTIIGNPPYIRTKKGNLYIDFIEKCYNLLDIEGELIFIIPSDFFKLTSSCRILNIMMENGTFTHIFHPHDEKMFENACIDVLIFRYCKNKSLEKIVKYNETLLYIRNSDGLITFEEKINENKVLIKDYFNIYVGLVSGREDVYKNEELGNINVLNGENKVERYIYIDAYPHENNLINNYLLSNKKCLMDRKIKKFDETNWFKWGAPRNIDTIKNNFGKDCIYVYNLTRKTTVSFIGKVNYFGGNLLMLIPKKECDLNKVVDFINSNSFKNNFTFSGRFKIGHRQISNSFISL